MNIDSISYLKSTIGLVLPFIIDVKFWMIWLYLLLQWISIQLAISKVHQNFRYYYAYIQHHLVLDTRYKLQKGITKAHPVVYIMPRLGWLGMPYWPSLASKVIAIRTSLVHSTRKHLAVLLDNWQLLFTTFMSNMRYFLQFLGIAYLSVRSRTWLMVNKIVQKWTSHRKIAD